MVRASVSIQIPEKYKKNEEFGLCKVCGKPKEQFEKLRRKYCSENCYMKYQECFVYWDGFRNKIIKRDNFTCNKCSNKFEASELEVDHIIPHAITDIVFDEDNVQTLCKQCHKKKTKKDLKKIKNHRNNQEELNL